MVVPLFYPSSYRNDVKWSRCYKTIDNFSGLIIPHTYRQLNFHKQRRDHKCQLDKMYPFQVIPNVSLSASVFSAPQTPWSLWHTHKASATYSLYLMCPFSDKPASWWLNISSMRTFKYQWTSSSYFNHFMQIGYCNNLQKNQSSIEIQ